MIRYDLEMLKVIFLAKLIKEISKTAPQIKKFWRVSTAAWVKKMGSNDTIQKVATEVLVLFICIIKANSVTDM